MDSSNIDIYKFKYEYGSNEESPSQRYEREYKERRETDVRFGRILSETDYIKIKNIIIENFTQRDEIEKITDEFIKSELSIVIKHVKNKHSHHMSSKYSYENY
jgi:hypothetical protein